MVEKKIGNSIHANNSEWIHYAAYLLYLMTIFKIEYIIDVQEKSY